MWGRRSGFQWGYDTDGVCWHCPLGIVVRDCTTEFMASLGEALAETIFECGAWFLIFEGHVRRSELEVEKFRG